MNIDLKDYAIPIEMTEKKDDLIFLQGKIHTGYIIVETHSNKKPKIVTEVKNGVMEGEFITNYEDGQIKSKSFIKNDKLHGNSSDYYTSGELEIEGCYNSGKKIGVWKSYYKNGKIRIEEEYSNDKPNGFYKKYDEEGNLILHALFEMGLLKKEILNTHSDEEDKPKDFSIGIEEDESIESMINKLNLIEGLGEKSSFCMMIYTNLLLRYNINEMRELYIARDIIDSGAKMPPENLKKLSAPDYEIKLFLHLINKKDKEIFKIFKEYFIQKFGDNLKEDKYEFYKGIGLFILFVILLFKSCEWLYNNM